MTESATTPDQQISALYAEANTAMVQLQGRVANARQAQQQAMRVTGEATSRDSSVRATVDATGVVTSLVLAPSVFDRSTPERLAQTVVATIQSAAAQSRRRLAAGMARAEPGEGVSAKAAEGLAAFGIPKPGVPAVPTTAADPTADDAPHNEPSPVNLAALRAWANGHATEPDPAPEPSRAPRTARPVARPTHHDAEDWASDGRPW